MADSAEAASAGHRAPSGAARTGRRSRPGSSTRAPTTAPRSPTPHPSASSRTACSCRAGAARSGARGTARQPRRTAAATWTSLSPRMTRAWRSRSAWAMRDSASCRLSGTLMSRSWTDCTLMPHGSVCSSRMIVQLLVELAPLREQRGQVVAADDVAQGALGGAHDRLCVVGDLDRRQARVDDAPVHDRVDGDRGAVLGQRLLGGELAGDDARVDRERRGLDVRQEEEDAWPANAAEASQAQHDLALPLAAHPQRREDRDDDQDQATMMVGNSDSMRALRERRWRSLSRFKVWHAARRGSATSVVPGAQRFLNAWTQYSRSGSGGKSAVHCVPVGRRLRLTARHGRPQSRRDGTGRAERPRSG